MSPSPRFLEIRFPPRRKPRRRAETPPGNVLIVPQIRVRFNRTAAAPASKRAPSAKADGALFQSFFCCSASQAAAASSPRASSGKVSSPSMSPCSWQYSRQ